AWRKALPSAWLLVPGFGAQGATLEDVRALSVPGAGGAGMLVTSSRAVLFPPAGSDDGAGWAAAIGRRAAGFAADLAWGSAGW
ncbi:MAG: hypothetical protein H0V89_01060, partial [Deltaproteobacteria bacterium]|nr:hypothetical protein [Deltaproteobacteria bacterium]